ncbi:hypothetical protein [Hymenobacter sublimis]|uniref:GAF domain-containing protein n=1 Tax=Hymenobacter sublimis TaxID=2933777 RepID=A0ABY4J945_9BACT|nr:hypothetical protein [Hymenobacter sublimis]UPL49345.1 hypothetical protein MWH26_00155 [Hymenobacter sublimis]
MAYSKRHQVTSWLADVSRMAPIGTDEQAWLSEAWLAEFATVGIHSVALIMPLGLHNQLVVENVLTDGRRYARAEVQFFSDIPAALDWLAPTVAQALDLERQWEHAKLQPTAESLLLL